MCTDPPATSPEGTLSQFHGLYSFKVAVAYHHRACVMGKGLCVLLQRSIRGFLSGTHKREHVSDKYKLKVTPWSYLNRLEDGVISEK